MTKSDEQILFQDVTRDFLRDIIEEASRLLDTMDEEPEITAEDLEDEATSLFQLASDLELSLTNEIGSTED